MQMNRRFRRSDRTSSSSRCGGISRYRDRGRRVKHRARQRIRFPQRKGKTETDTARYSAFRAGNGDIDRQGISAATVASHRENGVFQETRRTRRSNLLSVLGTLRFPANGGEEDRCCGMFFLREPLSRISKAIRR